MIKLNFKTDKTFDEGINRLASVLCYERGEGVEVYAESSDRIGVAAKDGKATIYYRDKVQFFRGLGVLVNNLKSSESFELYDDPFFSTVGTMLDTSRCAVPKLSTLYTLLDYLAVMGYNLAMLYTEDTIKLENRAYFGYMRGAYTVEELRALDDYAYEYGIELIPCLECYGHMGRYLFWPEAAPIKDTETVLLAREEKTFEFVEELIKTASSAFRSKRIHIGMDEAWDMGRGKFLDKHGYVPPFDICNEYMDRLIQITNKYGLRPMMWSDFYFRVANKIDDNYYRKETEIPDDVKAKIPKEVDLVFWHYGEMHECDDYMLEKHKRLDRNVIFAGGLWSWIGHFPEHNYALESTRFSMNACRNNDVREAIMTIWTNDNAECDLFANLYGLSFFAEIAYDNAASDEKLARRFEESTGGDAEGFYNMSLYHNKFEGKKYPRYNERFLGKPLFWQDIMEGLYDTHLFNEAMSGHYGDAKKKMQKASGGRWEYLYRFAELVFEYLEKKTYIAENLVPAYKSGDKAMLERMARELLPSLKETAQKVHKAHKKMWYEHNNIIGWPNMDIRYAGVAARCDSASELLLDYLEGRIDSLTELEEKRLDKGLSGFIHYSWVSTPNSKT